MTFSEFFHPQGVFVLFWKVSIVCLSQHLRILKLFTPTQVINPHCSQHAASTLFLLRLLPRPTTHPRLGNLGFNQGVSEAGREGNHLFIDLP